MILCLHGGGYVAGSGNYCRSTGLDIAKATGYKTLALDYRLAPEYPFSTALDDVMTAYIGFQPMLILVIKN